MTYRSLTEGFFQNILNSFLNVIENLGFVLGSIIFSIIGVIGYEIWNKYFGKEESISKELSYKKWTKFYEYLFMPFIFYIFGIFMGIFGFFGIYLSAFILDLIILIIYTFLGKLVNY